MNPSEPLETICRVNAPIALQTNQRNAAVGESRWNCLNRRTQWLALSSQSNGVHTSQNSKPVEFHGIKNRTTIA